MHIINTILGLTLLASFGGEEGVGVVHKRKRVDDAHGKHNRSVGGSGCCFGIINKQVRCCVRSWWSFSDRQRCQTELQLHTKHMETTILLQKRPSRKLILVLPRANLSNFTDVSNFRKCVIGLYL